MNSKSKIRLWLTSRKQFEKIVIIGFVDLFLLTLVVFVSYALRVSELTLPPKSSAVLYLVAPLFSIILAGFLSVYGAAVRGYSSSLEQRIFISQILAVALWAVLIYTIGAAGFARSTMLIYGIIAPLAMIFLRRFAALYFSLTDLKSGKKTEAIPVLIYGAGREGQLVLEGLRNQNKYKAVAFLDTDYTLVDRVVSGLKVFSIEDLEKVVTKFTPREMVIARHQSNIAHRRKLVDLALDQGLSVKTVPRLEDLAEGHVSVSDIRPVKVEDLLGRDPVAPDQALMEKTISGQVVMVTGAGGSIGSELVRQSYTYQPKKLILVDNSEFGLFEIHRQIESHLSSAAGFKCELVPILADAKDKSKMKSIMQNHDVDVVFHAAAYKHVRMVQENSAAGIYNNVFGTRSVAEAAVESQVQRFVLISTDKAVRPTSVMGASKRVAEMVVQAIAAEKGNQTNFSIVRFGNVLASTGSVVPLFQEQIANGGPVKVTHPDVTRYFMLIPEAVQLVVQAGAMANSGEVFVLDMGEPVKILNLAETMIELAGMTVCSAANPDGDIAIEFVGLRDGEKMYEELQIGRDVSPTTNPRIMRSNEFYLPLKKLDKSLTSLQSLLDLGRVNSGIQQVMELARLGSDPNDVASKT